MQDNDINMIAKTIGSVLAVVSCALILVGLTELGQIKTFRFVLGEFAVVTAIAYSFQTARGVSKFAPFGIVIWLTIASLNFAQAAWFMTQ